MSDHWDQIKNIGQLPSFYASAHPERVALYHFEGEINYGQLDRRANQVANGLAALDIPTQSRIILLTKNDPRFFELLCGAARAGVALAPANWRLTATELRFIIDDSEAPVVFVSAEYAPLIASIREHLPHVHHVIVLGRGGAVLHDSGAVDYVCWREAQDPAARPFDADPDDDVLQIYTSGTTGQPKGARLTNANFLFYMRQMAKGPIGPFPRGTVIMVPLPLFHVAGACWALNALFHGEANVIVREASAGLVIEAFRRFPITKAGLVPAVMKMVIEHPDAAQSDFSRLDTICYGGSPMSPQLIRQARKIFGCGFVQIFGMTESCALATFLSREDHDPANPERMLSVGKPADEVALRIIDLDGVDVPALTSGEVLIAGRNIMKGYWHRPDATSEAIIDGWYHTGDIGCIDQDGFLHVRDRMKDMIISGGENVYSVEVEKALSDCAQIADVAIIGIPDPVWGEAVKAMVVLRAGAATDPAPIIAHARARLAGYKCPKSVDFVSAIPRNAGGKILKRVLREPYWQDQAVSVT